MQGSTDPISLKKFRLDPGTGSLYTSEKLDHETMNQHILTVMVNKHKIYSVVKNKEIFFDVFLICPLNSNIYLYA